MLFVQAVIVRGSEDAAFPVDFNDPIFARLDTDEKKLLSEYAKAYPKIKNFYENMKMDVSVQRTNFSVNVESLESSLRVQGLSEDAIKDTVARSGQTDIQYEVRYRQQDGYARVDTKKNHPVKDTDSVRAKLPPGSPLHNFVKGDVIQDVGVFLLSPTMGYQLSKSDPSKEYFSLNMKRKLNKQDAEDFDLPLMYFDTAPFCEDADPLENIIFNCPPLIQGKPYAIEYVRQSEINGRQVVKIKCSRTDFTDAFREISLDRHSWVVVETYSKGGVMLPSGEREIRWTRETCTYDDIADSIPLLKTYQRSSGKNDATTREDMMFSRMQCEVTKIIPGPPDLSEFDVAQFLPPGVKIGEVTPLTFAQLSSARIAAIVIGIVLIILGIYLRRRNRNRT
jgi:hypothetical protein